MMRIGATTPLLCVALLAGVALAGCSGGGAGDGQPEADFSDLGLEATATTGVLRGVVVDTAIRPVPGVALVVTGADAMVRRTESNAEGLFGLDDLPPGDYFIVANRSGYIQTQSSASVVAGVAEPPIVKVLMQADPATLPFFEAYVMEGFIQCSVRPMFLGLQCGVTEEDVVRAIYPFARPPEHVQSEMVWQSTQAFGDELSLAIRCFPGEAMGFELDRAGKCPEGQRTIVRAEGKSPQVARINRTHAETWGLGPDGNPLIIDLFAFGRSDLDFYDEETVDNAQEPVTGKPCVDWMGTLFPPGTCVRLTGPGFIINQRVNVYTHFFYGYAPPEAWQFSVDQAVPPPPA